MDSFPKITTTPQKDITDLVANLLRQIYAYYPVGYCHFKNLYPGYLAMTEIVRKKLDDECNDPQSISNVFVTALKNSLPELRIENRNYLSFPNYNVIIRIEKKDYAHMVHDFYLELCVSLVCDYYTFFFVDEYRFKAFAKLENDLPNIASMHTSYSFTSNEGRISPNYLQTISAHLKTYFPEKKYIPHSVLMNHPISGMAPFGHDCSPDSKENVYTFYDLLFHFDFKQDSVVLE